MPIGKLTLELSIAHAQSLKDRRQVMRSMKDRLRRTFNLSIAEPNDGAVLWNRGTFEIAVISSSTASLVQRLHAIDRHAQRLAAGLSAEILDSYAELLAEGDGESLELQPAENSTGERDGRNPSDETDTSTPFDFEPDR